MRQMICDNYVNNYTEISCLFLTNVRLYFDSKLI